jgi:hypothetical protein
VSALDLELSSLDRMHFRTMFPAAMQPTITDPVTTVIVSGVGQTRCTPTAAQIPERFLSDIRQENPPAGTGSYLRGRGNLPSAASVKCAHASARRSDEESPHAPTTDMAGKAPLSYMYFHHWSVLGSRNPFPSRARWPAKSTTLFGPRISRWMGSNRETSALP